MTESDSTQINGQIQKRIDYYNSELEKNPDTAIEKTMKKFNLKQSRVYDIAKTYSQTPSSYKKNLRDAQAGASISADELIDQELNKEYGGMIDSFRVQELVKNAERLGYKVKDLFVKSLEYAIKNKVETVGTSDIMAITGGKNIDEIIPKPLEQQVVEKNAKADIIEAEVRIKQAETDIEGERFTRFMNTVIYDEKRRKLNPDTDDKNEDLYYDDDYREMLNEALIVRRIRMNPNYDRAYVQTITENFLIKWAFKRKQKEEIQLRRLQQNRYEEREKPDYNSYSLEQLYDLYKEEGGDPNNLIQL